MSEDNEDKPSVPMDRDKFNSLMQELRKQRIQEKLAERVDENSQPSYIPELGDG